MSSENLVFTGSAPGKIILFGEHAVVYGQPAIAAPVHQLQAQAFVRAGRAPGWHFLSAAAGLDRLLHSPDPTFWGSVVLDGIREVTGKEVPSFHLEIESGIPVASGLGSGAAVAVASIRAIAAFAGAELSLEQVNEIAFKAELLHHGTPSGIDNTVISHARLIWYQRDRPYETFRSGSTLQIMIADTGIQGHTRAAVGDVRNGRERDPGFFVPRIEAIGAVAHRARAAIIAGEVANLGALMFENQRLLEEIGVSSPELETLVQAAGAAGALGAKLSGGGRGGNMIALVDETSAGAVAAALRIAGAARTYETMVH